MSWPERRPRVNKGEARAKLLLLAQLSYAFLLTLLKTTYDLLRLWLLRYDNHRTGRHCRAAKMPLTRLRCSLSRLWQDIAPNFASLSSSTPADPGD